MRRIMLNLLITNLLILGQSFAQTQVLTLTEAVNMAQKQSYFSTVRKNNFSSDKIYYELFRKSLLPQILLQATPFNYSNNVSNILNYDGQLTKNKTSRINSAANILITQPITLTGGNLFIRSSLERNSITTNLDEVSYNYSSPSIYYNSTPIYLGYNHNFGSINHYKWDQKLKPMYYEIDRRHYVESNFDIALKTLELFSEVLFAETKLKLVEQNAYILDSLLQSLDESTHNTINLQKLHFDKNEAKRLTEQYLNEKKEAERNIKNYLNLPNEIGITCQIPSLIDSIFVSTPLLLEKVRKNNPDFLISDLQIEEAKRNLQSSKARRHDISLQFLADLTGSSDKIAESYNTLNKNQSFRIGLEVPLLNWGKNRKLIKLGNLKLENAIQSKSYIITEIENSLTTITEGFNIQYSQTSQALVLSTLACSNFYNSVNYFSQIKINAMDLSSLRKDKDTAKLQYILELTKYWQYFYSLSKISLYDFVNNVDLLEELE